MTSTPTPPTVPPGGWAHNRPGRPRPPSRSEIPAAIVEVLAEGEADKADLLVVDVGEGPMVVKDFAAKRGWVRLLGRIQIAREDRAYRWLEGVEGVPARIGRVDALALAIERIDGEQLAFHPDRFRRGAELLEGLRAVLDRIHARGVAHLDLRGRENVLVRREGSVVVVDLAGAILLRPGGLGHRIFFRALAAADEAAYLKWKTLLTPERLTDGERAFLRRFGAVRGLWPFNRKRGGENA